MVLIHTLNAMLCPSFVPDGHNSLYHNGNRRTSNPTVEDSNPSGRTIFPLRE